MAPRARLPAAAGPFKKGAQSRTGRADATVLLRETSTCWRVAIASRAAVLMDAEAYYRAARAAMARARRSVHLLNWAFEPETPFAPDEPVDEGHTFAGFLRRLASETPELDIRILCWQSALPIAATQNFFPLRAREAFAGGGVVFRLDGALPMGASHHQKMIVIDDELAFCGGADVGPDRWDASTHADDDPRRRRPLGAGFFNARHEMMMLVEGPPARLLGELFRRRWLRGVGEDLPPPPPASVAGSPAWPTEVEADFESAPVGVARTAPAWRDQAAERESERLYLAMIAAARRTIYLENQYLTSPVIAEALAERLAQAEGPEVVLVSARHSPSWFDQMTMDRTRALFLARLRRADAGGRMRAYFPLTRAGKTIIVHAKLAIIDDAVLRIGSSNLNNRSTGFDSECDLALEASCEAHRAAILGVRDCLVGHWLGLETEAITARVAAEGGLGAAIEALRREGHQRLAPIETPRLGPLARFVAAYHLGDPVSPADSWRPWRRRRDLRRCLLRAADALAVDHLPHPHDIADEALI